MIHNNEHIRLYTIGKAFSYSDPETSSDSEEDALRRLNSRSHPPPDTLTIQAEDGPTTIVGQLL
jgi:synaptotagmin-14/16